VLESDWSGANRAAEDSARRWREGKTLSALDGVPMTIKDSLLVAGMRATWGSRIYEHFRPSSDEAPIARLRAAGAVFVGKTNIPEFTLQGYTSSPLFGVTRNPRAVDRSTGGGGGAVAAGIGPIAIGTDGGGSIRRSAAHCGLFGFKPSIGQVARFGGFAKILHDFEVVGPIARSLEDVRTAFVILRGYDARDWRSLIAFSTARFGLSPRIAFVPRGGDAPVDPQIAEVAEETARTFEAIGCVVDEVAAPFEAEAASALWSAIAAIGLAWHLDSVEAWRERVGPATLATAERGARRSAFDYLDALQVLETARNDAGRFFRDWDVMLTPTTAALAWRADAPFPETIDGRAVCPRGHAVFTGWMNLVGAAAVSRPVAMTDSEGGIGMQLAASPGFDQALLDLAARWVEARGAV
jgi:aspartyl-tRNA(Asn)/glutamyl-tRNA(Gln) amidotransferase subunit A